jgi:transcriptional pleiotropic regulator of transition state genes
MNINGIARNVDSLGRIVIPHEARELLLIALKDPLEIFIDEEAGKPALVFKKYTPGCIFCNTMDDCIRFKDKLVCRKCLDEL